MQKSKYKSLAEWQKADPKAYAIAHHKELIGEICKTFGWKLRTKWTLELCLEEAKKYKTKTEWQKNNGASFQGAYKNGWITQCVEHMNHPTKPRGYWTLERCLVEARKHKTWSDWQRECPSSYRAFYKMGGKKSTLNYN